MLLVAQVPMIGLFPVEPSEQVLLTGLEYSELVLGSSFYVCVYLTCYQAVPINKI